MFSEDDLLPISALQHLLYCERQCALIHVERLWAENRFTLEGRHLHERADAGRGERRPRRRVARALPLRSFRLGLFGKADVVEFHPIGSPAGQPMSGGSAVPFPVEYKRGKPKKNGADVVQLCAQALCLEEMLTVVVPCGALFYGRTRRRVEVPFDAALRELTERTAARLHELLGAAYTPPAVYEKRKCERCSLKNLCLPEAFGPATRASRYLERSLAGSLAGGPAQD